MKLELGPSASGSEGYDYIDYKEEYGIPYCFDMSTVKNWPIESDKYSEVLAIHVIEHFDSSVVNNVFSEVFRCLKPGGEFKVHVPNGNLICNVYLNNPMIAQGPIYGGEAENISTYSYAHKRLYNYEMLRDVFAANGFVNIKDFTYEVYDVHDQFWEKHLGGRISLKLIGTKPI